MYTDKIQPTQPLTTPNIAVVCDDRRSASAKNILNKLEAAGADVVVINYPKSDAPAEHVENWRKAQKQAASQDVDGVVLMGSNYDIDPSDYGQSPQEEYVEHPNGNRKVASTILLNEALANDKPFLGICGGMQRLNVHLGGDLIQHVEGEWQTEPYHEPTQFVYLEPQSELAKILGDAARPVTMKMHHAEQPEKPLRQIPTNTMHHQAVAGLGRNLHASALSNADKFTPRVVEAIEYRDPEGKRTNSMIGVQWHPEFLDCGETKALIDHIVEQARDVRKAKNTDKKSFVERVADEREAEESTIDR